MKVLATKIAHAPDCFKDRALATGITAQIGAGENMCYINGMDKKDFAAGVFSSGVETLESLYGDGCEEARRRYASLTRGMAPGAGFPAEFAPADGGLRAFSAPGRTELAGNHTDHNRGKVLAASVQMDIAAAVTARDDGRVFLRSAGFPDTVVSLRGEGDLSPRPEERGTTTALVRGIAAGFAARGAEVRGFAANAASEVPQGSGLSSSAALEVLVAKIFDSLRGDGGNFSALELAQIGQEAENEFFGKPCGLMDQAACASGGAVAIDFADPAAPELRRIGFDPLAAGIALCAVDTRGSHADLTPDYAAIPEEMRAVARIFGKFFLREIDLERSLSRASEIRASLGDRALLRAIHFFNENRRVAQMTALLEELETERDAAGKRRCLERFMDLVNESGDSSWELLQNMYSPRKPREQGLCLALAASREFFRANGLKAACRVHGGGFAGTALAFVPSEALGAYRSQMEALFGANSVTLLRVRDAGATEVKLI